MEPPSHESSVHSLASSDLDSLSGDDADFRPHVVAQESCPGDDTLAEIAIQQVQPQVAQAVSKMEVVNPEILRVTAAHQAFHRCGYVLHPDWTGDAHHKSWKCERISTFWSHSWHGGHRKKLLTLITFYNSRAAVCLGMVSAVVMTVVHSLGYLPSFMMQFSNSVPLAGSLTTIAVLVLWRPTAQVFLDRICISSDESLKTQCILSLAGFLKRSDQMLILWDPTWAQRLWCLFEFAAFLKCKASPEERLRRVVIRPTIIGGVSIGCFGLFLMLALALTTAPNDEAILYIPALAMVMCGLLVGYPAASLMREYFRSLDVLEEQLLSVSFAKTRSSCCDLDHISPSGARLLCDRRIVQDCVTIWFGSEAAFEESVRREVLTILKEDLKGKVFTREWARGVTIPVFWADLGFAAHFARLKMWDRAASFVIDGLVLTIVVVPPMAETMLQICRLYRHQGKSACSEVRCNVLVIFLCASLIVCALALYLLGTYAIYIPVYPNGEGSYLLSSASYFISMLIQAYCSQLLVQRWKTKVS